MLRPTLRRLLTISNARTRPGSTSVVRAMVFNTADPPRGHRSNSTHGLNPAPSVRRSERMPVGHRCDDNEGALSSAGRRRGRREGRRAHAVRTDVQIVEPIPKDHVHARGRSHAARHGEPDAGEILRVREPTEAVDPLIHVLVDDVDPGPAGVLIQTTRLEVGRRSEELRAGSRPSSQRSGCNECGGSRTRRRSPRCPPRPTPDQGKRGSPARARDPCRPHTNRSTARRRGLPPRPSLS